MSASTEAAVVEKVSPPPDSALALRQTASSVKRVQANGMKPTIIEDSESDEDAIVSAKGKWRNDLGLKWVLGYYVLMYEDTNILIAITVDSKTKADDALKSLQNPNDNQKNNDGDEEDDEDDDEDDDDDVAAPPPEGMYDPNDYENLNVSADIKELFSDILRCEKPNWI